MSACIRRCTVSRRHVPPCTCTLECPDHDGHCSGCQPTEATRGLLCAADSRRFREHLGSDEQPDGPHGLAWAWDHLAAAYPSLTSWLNGAGEPGGVTDAEAERLAAVLALRSDIRDWLGAVVADLAERTGMHGPSDIDWTTDYRPRLAGRQQLGRDRTIVRSAQAWLLRNVEPLEAGQGTPAGAESVIETYDMAADLMSRAHALAPWRPAPTRIDGIPCRCGALTLHDHGDEVKCWSCGTGYTREHYRTLTKVYARRFAEETVAG